MKYKLAIFDMDGTVLNTLEDLADSLNYALSESNYPKRTIEEVRSFVGNGIRRLVERGVPEGTDESSIQTVHNNFMTYYQKHCADKTKPYEGILKLLSDLRDKGCKTAIVSNKADSAVKELCQQYFPGMFDYAVGERTGIKKKPAPDSILETINALEINLEDAVYIGDSDVDIQSAQNAGMDSIIVNWGFRDTDFLRSNGAKIIVSQTQEIYNIIVQ